MEKTKRKRLKANSSGLKRIGIMFIIVGFFIPLVLYPFTELTDEADKDRLMANYQGAKYTPRLIELKVGSVRYPSIIAIGLTFIFVGISIIVLTGKKNLEKPKPKTPAAQPSHKSKRKLSAKNVKKAIVVDEITEKVEADALSSTEAEEITNSDNEVSTKPPKKPSILFYLFYVFIWLSFIGTIASIIIPSILGQKPTLPLNPGLGITFCVAVLTGMTARIFGKNGMTWFCIGILFGLVSVFLLSFIASTLRNM